MELALYERIDDQTDGQTADEHKEENIDEREYGHTNGRNMNGRT